MKISSFEIINHSKNNLIIWVEINPDKYFLKEGQKATIYVKPLPHAIDAPFTLGAYGDDELVVYPPAHAEDPYVEIDGELVLPFSDN